MIYPKIAVIVLSLLFLAGTEFSISQTTDLVLLNFPKEIYVDPRNTGELKIEVIVKNGYHVQANPASHEFLIPVSIESISGKGLSFGNPAYPIGKPLKIETSEEPLSVYDGKFYIDVPFEVSNNSQITQTELNGTFQYQTCDYKRCYFPRSIEFSRTIKIIKN